GAGTLVIAGTATGLTGGIAIDAGTLRVGNGGTAGSLAAGTPISVASGAVLAFNRSDTYGGSISSVISGSGGVRVESGLVTLTAAQIYSGSTNVLAGGTLAVNGSLANAGLLVSPGGVLMGTGTILGATTIQGSHQPGASPGVETFADLTYSGSSASVTWELWNNVATNSPVAYDQVIVNGNLTFVDPTQLELSFTGTASQVDWRNSFWDLDRQWLLYDVAGTTSGIDKLSIAPSVWLDSFNRAFATERPFASFTVNQPQSSSDVLIVYAAAPEPSGIALVAGAAAVLAVATRRRVFRTVAILWLVTAAVACGLLRPAAAAAPEIRGTWMTTTNSDDWSAANVQTTMNSLKRTGLNTVYVEAWKNGYTNFNSPTLAAFTGSPSLNPSLGSRILLNETRTAAAAAGIVHGAWFEYGLMSEFGGAFNPLSLKCQNATWTVGTTSGTGWLLEDQSGNYTNGSNNFVWMNPLVPEVRNLIKGIVVDAINQFDLQIVQFDDHLAWPVQFGWDAYTKAVYKQETNKNLPTNTSDSNFLAWRQGKTQAFFAEIAAAAKAAKPSVVVSLAPSVSGFSAANYCADWSKWMGSTDEVLPQVYRSTYSAFASQWPAEITASGSNRAELGAGLRLLGTGSATPWTDLQQQIDRTRTDGALGHSIWYSEGVTTSGTSNPSNYNTQLTAYYDVPTNGIAANPHFQSTRWSGTGGNGGSGTWSQLAAQ
ncbi:MAG: family 10 glycosylhydrolase, partial [Planctomycetaceae bacterium]